MQSDFFSIVKNPFNLQTFQRRLRHLHSIAVRNLHCPKYHDIDFSKLEVFFTLHASEKSKAFYTSEKITGSLNPTWQSFDLQRRHTDVDQAAKFVILKIWFSYENVNKLALVAHVNLTGLVFYSHKLQVPGMKYPPNTLLFGLFSSFFIYYDKNSTSPQLDQWISDKEIPIDSVPAVVKVDQALQKSSYNINSLSRMHTVQKAIKQTQASVQRVHSDIEDKLLSSNEHSEKLCSREVLLMKVRQLRKELLWQSQQLQLEQDSLEQFRAQQENRSQLLKEKRFQLATTEKETEEKRTSHIQSREMLVKENAQVLFRRKQIISEMVHYIYPVTEDEKHCFFINGVRLPNAEDYQGQDEVRLSVALGYTCHLTQMVSHFMDMPLRYPMVHRGSRSTIIDHVHSKLTDKDREFPLYGKGKEKFQYNYAVFLLNKNISQLRFYCGLGTNDLRQTLPNFKTLLEQRLGVRISSSLEQRGPTIQSPPATSIGESPASRQAVSSSASSYTRKDVTFDMDAVDRLPKPPASEASLPKVGSFHNFDNSSTSSVHSAGQEWMGQSDPPLAAQLSNSLHRDLLDGQRHAPINGFKASSSQNEGNQPRKTINEEDETEELFHPSDDHFFKVVNQPIVQEFNQLIGEHVNGDSASHATAPENVPQSSVTSLKDGLLTTFKLVRHTVSTSVPGHLPDSEQSSVARRQLSLQGAGSLSRELGADLYAQSLSYDGTDSYETQDSTVD